MPSGREPKLGRLRLRAVDAEDLSVIAACLQDALIPLSEMVYLAEQNRFVAAFTRFRRECLANPEACEGLTQCQSALCVEKVQGVKFRGLDPRFARVRHELLTLTADAPDEDGIVRITLVFAGEAAIQLRTRGIDVKLEDFGDPAPARCVPVHDLPRALAAEGA